jgi:predicted PurR-regulated permease PerM
MNRPIEESHSRPARRSLATTPLRVLACIAVGAVLYYGHEAFVPVVLAVLFSLVLTTPVEALHRRGLPRGVAAAMILLGFVVLMGGAVNLLWTPAHSWWESAPRTIRTVERRLQPVARLLNRVEALTERPGDIAAAPAPQARKTAPATTPAQSTAAAGANPTASAPAAPVTAAAPAPTSARAPSAPNTPSASSALTVLDMTRAAIMEVVTIVITMMFLLTGGPPMLARMTAALGSDLQSSHMLKVINAVRSEVGRYYGSIALINIGLGLATTGVTMALGMPSPLLWGAVAAMFNFVPYVGSATTLLLLTLVAFVSFDSVGRVLGVAGGYLALTTIEGQIVQPLVVGRRLELHPMFVFLALWFGGWFWGIAGIVIAIPTLVSIKVVAEHARGGKQLQEFMSPNELHPYHPKHVVAASLRLRRSDGS